jgi:hypothetical protein
MLHDGAPIERTRLVEPIVAVEHGLDAFAFAAWLEQLDGVFAPRSHGGCRVSAGALCADLLQYLHEQLLNFVRPYSGDAAEVGFLATILVGFNFAARKYGENDRSPYGVAAKRIHNPEVQLHGGILAWFWFPDDAQLLLFQIIIGCIDNWSNVLIQPLLAGLDVRLCRGRFRTGSGFLLLLFRRRFATCGDRVLECSHVFSPVWRPKIATRIATQRLSAAAGCANTRPPLATTHLARSVMTETTIAKKLSGVPPGRCITHTQEGKIAMSPQATTKGAAEIRFQPVKGIRRLPKEQRFKNSAGLVANVRPWTILASEILACSKKELIAKVEADHDAWGSFLADLDAAEDAARAINKLIGAAKARLAVALVNVEGVDDSSLSRSAAKRLHALCGQAS